MHGNPPYFWQVMEQNLFLAKGLVLICALCTPIFLNLSPPLGSEVCAKCRSLVSYVLHRVRFRDVGRSENLGGRGRGRVIIDLPISEGTCKV